MNTPTLGSGRGFFYSGADSDAEALAIAAELSRIAYVRHHLNRFYGYANELYRVSFFDLGSVDGPDWIIAGSRTAAVVEATRRYPGRRLSVIHVYVGLKDPPYSIGR